MRRRCRCRYYLLRYYLGLFLFHFLILKTYTVNGLISCSQLINLHLGFLIGLLIGFLISFYIIFNQHYIQPYEILIGYPLNNLVNLHIFRLIFRI